MVTLVGLITVVEMQEGIAEAAIMDITADSLVETVVVEEEMGAVAAVEMEAAVVDVKMLEEEGAADS